VISKSEIVSDACSDALNDRYNASDDLYNAQNFMLLKQHMISEHCNGFSVSVSLRRPAESAL
jgi:hypothetical protein